jgi:DNA-binding transcriptional ArsR family regulator
MEFGIKLRHFQKLPSCELFLPSPSFLVPAMPELPPPDPAPPVPVAEFPNPVRLLEAIADPVRYEALRTLATGLYLTPLDLSKKVQVSHDNMAKHMRLLKARGAVQLVRPENADGRAQYYQIPQRFRQTTDTGRPLLDYGVCVIRF